jgi:hypothetical protein
VGLVGVDGTDDVIEGRVSVEGSSLDAGATTRARKEGGEPPGVELDERGAIIGYRERAQPRRRLR